MTHWLTLRCFVATHPLLFLGTDRQVLPALIREILNKMAYINSDHISCLKIGTQSDQYKHTSGIHHAVYMKPGQVYKTQGVSVISLPT